MDTNYLDDFCEAQFGHKDWLIRFDDAGNFIVTFFKQPRAGYVENEND